jgi:hypothetical protein
MKLRGVLGGAVFAILLAGSFSAAFAVEARPWLCRDKPVFSSDKPMAYEIGGESGSGWKLYLMQFEPDAAHDGFDIVTPGGLKARASGQLPAGQYFVVAMHRAGGGHWICHQSSRPLSASQPGAIAGLCFSNHESSPCRLTLAVRGVAPAATSLTH